ncbi:hypothetical protein Q666_16755 [Marinobacter sp. ES-1]|uniref:type I restriction-modification system subunit M N-terminal domain-containing protein n=1 Tax=Marinobacter sp. ES-1 TaxID=1396858 RepID=UPI0003B8A2E0|nr:type I restriction-modification system subunit M N-terminal domain-containing protein [Marinobacter sp. ES-1]ERP85493.1 hypothetical protein Q666_16755 [Marinobacter sp. ES-1]
MSKASSPVKKNTRTFEQTLWDTADKLRGTVESSEYKHVVLSLIFLKFVSDKFEARKQALVKEGQEAYVDMVEFYTMKNVFYLPEHARWNTLQKQAKQDDIAVKIDSALFSIEKLNPSLKGALPDNYFSRMGLEASKLAALIDSIRTGSVFPTTQTKKVAKLTAQNLGRRGLVNPPALHQSSVEFP